MSSGSSILSLHFRFLAPVTFDFVYQTPVQSLCKVRAMVEGAVMMSWKVNGEKLLRATACDGLETRFVLPCCYQPFDYTPYCECLILEEVTILSLVLVILEAVPMYELLDH